MNKYKKGIRAAAFLLLICLINVFLNTSLVQVGLTRFIVHDFDKDRYECVIFGQSHSSYGIDPATVEKQTGLKTMNMAVGGQYMMDLYYYVQHMYDEQNPKMVVLDLDYQYFIHVPNKTNTIMSTLMYYNYPLSWRKIPYAWNKLENKEYRAALFPWMNHRNDIDIWYPILMNKLSAAYRDYNPATVTQIEKCDTYKGRGFISRDRSFVKDECKVGILWDEASVDYKTSVEYFKKIVKYCEEKGSQVVLITTPINPQTLIESDQEYNQIEQYMDNMADSVGLPYYNFNIARYSVFRRTNDDYWDYDGHMYGDTAERYSKFLGKFLKKLYDGEEIDTSKYFYKDIFKMRKAYESDKIKF